MTVRLIDANGNPLTGSGGGVVISASVGTISGTTDNGNGTYTATLTSTGVQGTTVTSTLSFTVNAAPATATTPVVLTDAVAPPAPAVNPTTGVTVTGTAQPGSTVTVKNAAGSVLCTTTADAAGAFSCPLNPQQPNGAVLSVTATDAAGNVSPSTTVTVNAPTALLSIQLLSAVLHPGDTAVAVGTGFLPGESVTGVMNSTPIQLGTQIADANGTVTFTWTLPDNIDLGIHQIVLTGAISGPVTGTIEIIPRDQIAAALARTGIALATLTLPALLFLAAGALLMNTRRRHITKTT